MTNVTPVSTAPERAAVAAEAVAPAGMPAKEPSMFDTIEWTSGADPVPPPAPKYAGVRFQQVGKLYTYIADGFPQIKVGDWVIVDTVRGKQMGQVATVKRPRNAGDNGAYKRIERMASGRDMALRHYYENKELEAMIACRAESKTLDMPIKIVKAEYSFDGQSLTFLFASDQEERVETNDLRQVMSRLYRARVELRQISPREVAKVIGGMGACGIEQRCCSRFLTDFSPISIKHAKEQGLSLNPHDITGMCGRLRCCLIYEYEQYVEARRLLPKKNAIVGTPSGQGKVLDLLPLRDSVLVLIGEGETAKGIVVHRQDIVPLEELKRLQDKAASGTCDKHEGGNCDCGKGKTEAKGATASVEAGRADAGVATTVEIGTSEAMPAVAPVNQTQAAAGSRNTKHKKKGNAPASAPAPAGGGQEARPATQGQGQGRPNRPARAERERERDARGQPQGQPRVSKPGQQPDPNQNRHTLIRPKRLHDGADRPPREGQSAPVHPAPMEKTALESLEQDLRAQAQPVSDMSAPASSTEFTPAENTPESQNPASDEADRQNRQQRRPLRRPLQRKSAQPGSTDQPSQESGIS